MWRRCVTGVGFAVLKVPTIPSYTPTSHFVTVVSKLTTTSPVPSCLPVATLPDIVIMDLPSEIVSNPPKNSFLL